MGELVISVAENGWIVKYGDKTYVADDMYALKTLIGKLLEDSRPEETA